MDDDTQDRSDERWAKGASVGIALGMVIMGIPAVYLATTVGHQIPADDIVPGINPIAALFVGLYLGFLAAIPTLIWVRHRQKKRKPPN